MTLLLLLACSKTEVTEPSPAASLPAPAVAEAAPVLPPEPELPRAPSFEKQLLEVGVDSRVNAQAIARDLVDLAEGWEYESPAVALSTSGELFTVHVAYDRGRERLELRRGDGIEGLGEPVTVSEGARAWDPVMAAGADGSVWLAWTGRKAAGDRSTLSQEVFLRRVDRLGPILQVSESGAQRSGGPDLAVGADGIVHLVWEQDTQDGVQIAFREVADAPLGDVELLSSGWLNRRPSVAVQGDKVHVGWDALVTQAPVRNAQLDGPVDPDYDLRLKTRDAGEWRGTQGWTRKGIQAAPDLVATPDALYVAFHDSYYTPLVKWVGLLKVDESGIQHLYDDMGRAEPSGEQQGAERPSLSVLEDGTLALVSRSSQGAYLHVVGERGFALPLDLTRAGWGARGQRALVASTGNTVYSVRKARKASIVERFVIPAMGAPTGWNAVQFGPAPAMTPQASGHAVMELARGDGTQKVYLGDVHMHSSMSDATGPADEIIARAWARGLDFCTLTDHDYVIGSRMLPSEHEEQAWLTERFNSLPGFATIQAYEWTTPLLPTGSGHRILYFRDMAPNPILGFKDGAANTVALNQGLANEKAFSVPHHTSWTGTDWENFDPEIQRNFELVSVHGLSETPGEQVIASRGDMAGMFAVDGLKQGLQYGFVGGSDGHGLIWHHGIARRPDPWTQGLTGVLADSGDRESLWDALYARHTLATSGAPMGAILSVKGASNGDVVLQQGPVELSWSAQGSRTLTEIHILRNGEVVHQVSGDGLKSAGTFVDEPGHGSYSYYLRVVQTQDEWTPDAAWSSPVFVNVQAAIQ